MSFYSDASLAMIPSGYKDQKVYSALPITGDGDLTFSRASSATRVASNGLIEKVRTNLILQSQAFNTSWASDNGGGTGSVNVTANYGVAPDGTTTADRIELTRGTLYANIYQNISTTAGQEYTASVYLKSLSGAPTVSFLYDSIAYSTTLTSGWVRVSVTYTASGSTTAPLLGLFGGDSATADFLAWGYQLETGVMTDYIATTTTAVSVGPVSGLPRLDYLDSSAPRLLLEPQRTNVTLYSEQFDNAAWNKDPATTTITANNAVSPDGYTNADLFGSSSPSVAAGIYQTILGLTPAATYYISAYVKLGTATNVCITVNNTVAWDTVGGQSFSAADGLNTNTWTRVGFSFTAPAGANINYHIGVHSQTGVAAQSLGTFLVWGAQVEAGAYATSYIPTLGTSVTRVADAASKTSASALIGQTEGTVFWEIQVDTPVAAGHEDILNLDAGSFGDTIYISKTPNGVLLAEIYTGGVLQASFSSSVTSAGTYKCAIGYANNNSSFFVNGVQVGPTDTSCSVPATSRIQLGNGVLGASTDLTKQVLLFPTRLSNSDLAALTA
jgi:hypothetical protein